MFSVLQFLVFVFVFGLTAFIFRRKRPKNFPPGPSPLPVIGNIHQLGREPHKTFMKMGEKYGNIFAIDFGSWRGVVLNDSKSIKEALALDVFSGRPRLRPLVERSGGIPRGVLFTDGPTWVHQRRFILKTVRDFGFGKKIIEGTIHEEIKDLAEIFQRDIGKSIVIKNHFNGPVLNSLWHILTGNRFAADDPDFKRIVYYLTEAVAESKNAGAYNFFPILSKLFPEWTGYNKFMKVMLPGLDIIKETILNHKNTFQDGDNRDFIDVYLQEILKTKDPNSSFFGDVGESNLTFDLVDMFIAGTETTSTVLTWVVFIMSLKVEEQEKLFQEIRNVVGLSRLTSLTDRESMPFTEALIMEVLRISAIAPLSAFHATTQDVEFMGYKLPKGTFICPNQYGVLRDPKTWGDPDEFRPDRFILPDGNLNRHLEGFIPFSTGKRVCLGETLARDTLFLFVTTLFQKFQVSIDRSQPVPSITECIPGLVLMPKRHHVIFRERS